MEKEQKRIAGALTNTWANRASAVSPVLTPLAMKEAELSSGVEPSWDSSLILRVLDQLGNGLENIDQRLSQTVSSYQPWLDRTLRGPEYLLKVSEFRKFDRMGEMIYTTLMRGDEDFGLVIGVDPNSGQITVRSDEGAIRVIDPDQPGYDSLNAVPG